MLDTLREKANNLPLLPGVYIMLNAQNEVIYVGKAKKLKNRVSSYFHGEHLPKVAAMVEKVADFNVIVAGSEFEALVLENSLIKRHKPHYNILLKDDKGYPFIRMDLRSEYPSMTLANKPGKDGARYFGPYGSRGQTKEIISTISKALLLPDCGRKFPRDIGKERPCLNYHMGCCAGWCLRDSNAEDYRKSIMQAVLVLEGKSSELVDDLRQQMEQEPSQAEEPSSEETSTGASANPTLASESASSATSYSVRLPSEYLLNSTVRLFHQVGQIFRDNAAPPSNPMGIRIDSKRRKKLMQKRLAMGHKQDDHEQEQDYGQVIR